MNVILHGIGLCLTLAALPPLSYLALYLALRGRGKLRVNREGWLAESVYLGSRIVFPALGLFAVFQPPLRLESALRRRLFRDRSPGEQAVSEVVVEVVTMA